MLTLPPATEMEKAYRAKDKSYDGVFFFAVRSTGIFCKPSCAARNPLPENVEYFPTAREAITAGYRPCLRCHPVDGNDKPPGWVARLLALIERNSTAKYSDAQLRSFGIEPSRARRYFRKYYGITFQAYCRERRLGQSLEQIRRGTDLDDVALGFGYNSHSGFREAFVKTFGLSPGRSRSCDCIVSSWIESPIGPLLTCATSEGICLLEFSDLRRIEGQFSSLRRHFKCAIVPGSNNHIEQLRHELEGYFKNELKNFSVNIHYPGTPFQRMVWSELLRIPYGTTVSYDEIARRIRLPGASRAVGTANGMNRIAIVIPCHRVINKDGNLGGYGGGVWRKKMLLELEQGVRSFSDEPQKTA